MARIITDYLDYSAERLPNKTAFVDQRRFVTFAELQEEAYHVAQALINEEICKCPIAIYLPKSVECIISMQGVLYSGNFFSVMNVDAPVEYTQRILQKLEPKKIITDRVHAPIICNIFASTKTVIYEDIQSNEIQIGKILEAKRNILAIDVSHVVFTSGSTGMPKGVVISHSAVIEKVEARAKVIEYREDDVFANQCPLYYATSLYADILGTIRNGATDYLMPKELFYQPSELVKFISEKKVTSLDWVSSALRLLFEYDVARQDKLSRIQKVVINGESMSTRILNKMREELPQSEIYNVFASTEGGVALIKKINRFYSEGEPLPIGKPLDYAEIILLMEQEENGVEYGEIHVRSAGIAKGYYKDQEKSGQVFVQNPLHNDYMDIVVKTGDLARIDENGDYVYLGRKDFQIKKSGHRINLGEIEACASLVNGVHDCGCVFQESDNQILLYYVGDATVDTIVLALKEKLPRHYMPDRIIKRDRIPKTESGKINRKRLFDEN